MWGIVLLLAGAAQAQTGPKIPFDQPYLQLATPTSIILRWRSEQPNAGRVCFGEAPDKLSQIIAGENTTEHEVHLTGLRPQTRYYYSIGTAEKAVAGGDTDHFFMTPAVPGPARPTRILVIADLQGVYDTASQVRDAYLKYSAGRYTDVFLAAGDNTHLFDFYMPLFRQTPLWPTIGNHDTTDYNGKEGIDAYYRNLNLPAGGEAGGTPSGTEHYYSFDYANIHFICLNSEEESMEPDGPMVTWLKKDAAATKQHWLIAYWHRAPFSRGVTGSDADRVSGLFRAKVVPVVEQLGVDLVLCGHTHVWEHSYLLNGHYGLSSTFQESNKLSHGDGRADGDGPYRKKAGPNSGTVYVVAGSAVLGNQPMKLDHPANAKGVNAIGSTVIDVDGDRMDLKYLGADGKVLDYFTLMKQSE